MIISQFVITRPIVLSLDCEDDLLTSPPHTSLGSAMMMTRRKAKTAAVDQETDPTQNNSLSNIEIPDDLDIESLQNILPDTSLTSPTPESILQLYRVLLAQVVEADSAQRALEEARAEGERKEVELDQALQDKESLSKDFDASLESLQSELKEVKHERDQLSTGPTFNFIRVDDPNFFVASSRTTLQAQITALSTSQSSSSTEVDTLKHRVEDTEREKRDLVGVVSRLKEDSSQREGE